MSKIKQPSVAGMFYPGDKDELLKIIKYFAEHASKGYPYTTRAAIVPHAGYEYSGQLAFNGIQHLDADVENVFIFAPAHRTPVDGAVLSSYDEWMTPMGNVAISHDFNEDLIKNFGLKYLDEAFSSEHAIEVQIPFLQSHLKKFKIIPILVGQENPDIIRDIIFKFYDNKKNAFIISSDLSHFHENFKAKEIDSLTAQMVESRDLSEFTYEQACGAAGIYGLVAFAAKKDFSLIRVGMWNSGEVTGDNSRVVGYGSWLLYEGSKNKFIEHFFRDYTINVVKKSIEYTFDFGKKMSAGILDYVPEVFREMGACFVTLEIDGNLRGCIGSIIATRPLIDDLVLNSYNAAFSDSRFNPLERFEFENVKVAISLLSTPVKMDFKDESDLLSQIVPNTDGIIIQDRGYQAVYLPSVWEQLPNKVEFLQSLKIKAGMSPQHFSNTFEAYRFYSTYIKE